ncbi:MAG: 2-amino-4-hydroxy-6-hydroxymethyldihydropteridine diphosphokinase [Gammaproteobacteria bacterium]|nr:2-amino-4-hydroxy-6-hydroxymethyldihydropteridine diphosphokinase [Gammaproteobacteria bacterium]
MVDRVPIQRRRRARGHDECHAKTSARLAPRPPPQAKIRRNGAIRVKPVRAYIGLGSNLADPVQQVARALDELASIPQSQLVARSRLYRSAPLGPPDQPDYINAVAVIDTALAAKKLLHQLQQLESMHGRVRDGERWGPRTLDLDLLLYGDEISSDDELTLPHPGAHERIFVLAPLWAIAPAAVIPGKGRVVDLLEACQSQHIEVVDSSAPAR